MVKIGNQGERLNQEGIRRTRKGPQTIKSAGVRFLYKAERECSDAKILLLG